MFELWFVVALETRLKDHAEFSIQWDAFHVAFAVEHPAFEGEKPHKVMEAMRLICNTLNRPFTDA